ncbi:unannotated protein [freshwater metagenome]|uniref:Unannotated protein n=1 Tax=freshwater metagenome TaxID=449393 RepID=A0A6J7EHY3_9ZZZZ|nr:hypothetical protein [Actinomycetota bacterium]
MRAITLFQRRVAAALIIVGVGVGVFGAVRSGSILIALGTGIIALAQWGRSSGRRRIIETYFPLALAGVLFTLAIALPKGL